MPSHQSTFGRYTLCGLSKGQMKIFDPTPQGRIQEANILNKAIDAVAVYPFFQLSFLHDHSYLQMKYTQLPKRKQEVMVHDLYFPSVWIRMLVSYL